jgi:alkylation response protein AidB-like acyl-CoA dehydrogenase
MDFDFSAEQYAFRDSIRGFLADRPAATTAPPAAEDAAALRSGLADLGVFSAIVPEEHDGLGLGFVDLALIVEEFGRWLVPPSIIETLTATDVIVAYGSAAQKNRLLGGIAAGRLSLSTAIAEADAGYASESMACMLTPGGSTWRLNGAKILVVDAMAADYLLVAVKCGDAPVLLIIERGRAGIRLREHTTFDLGSIYHEATFEDVEIHATDFLGGSENPEALGQLLDAGAVSAATFMTGIAGRVLDTTVDYVKQRNQFGKPIGSFQAIKHKCADMAVAVDSSRSAAYYAAWTLSGEASERSKAVSTAKSFCGDSARFVCNEGTQLHGGMGFTWALGLHLYLRRVKMLEYAYGDANHHRRRVLAEALRALGVGQAVAVASR